MSSSRRRLIRLTLTGLVVLLLAGFGAFSTFFFNPFEGDYEFDIATLLPRDVDFFAAKADLRKDFDPFPIPAFADEFQASRAGLVIQRQDWYREFLAKVDVHRAMDSLNKSLEQSPIALEPMELFGGEDLAMAGYFDNSRLGDSRWALLGRTGWIGKLGVELLDRPGWIGLDKQGILVEPVQAVIQTKELQVGVTLSGGQLTRPLTIGRVNDVIVVATDPQLVIDAVRLGSVRGEDSFGLSAKFADNIDVNREGDEIELFVDAVKLSTAMGWDGAWPDRGADTFLPAFLGRLFQIASVNELAGRIDVINGLTVDLQGQLSSELLGNIQKRLYRRPHFDKVNMREVAKLAPRDVGLFVYLNCDISDMLNQALDSLDEATISLFEDLVREVWGYTGAPPLIEEIDAALKGKVAFFARANDYAPSTEDPPHDGATVLVWALALRPDNGEKLAEILEEIRNRPQAFGLKGLKPGQNGIYTNTLSTGSKIVEYMNPLVPGTGQIVTLEFELRKKKYFLVSNSRYFLNQIDLTAWDINGEGANSLSIRPDFEVYVNTGMPSASVLAWVNPRAVGAALRTIAEELVKVSARSQIDWAEITPAIEKRILRDKFGGVSEANLTENQRDEFEILLNTETDEIEVRETAEALPRMLQEANDRIATWEMISAALFELALDPKKLAFHSRIAVPLDPPGSAN